MRLDKLTSLISRLVDHDGVMWGCLNFGARAKAHVRSKLAHDPLCLLPVGDVKPRQPISRTRCIRPAHVMITTC